MPSFVLPLDLGDFAYPILARRYCTAPVLARRDCAFSASSRCLNVGDVRKSLSFPSEPTSVWGRGIKPMQVPNQICERITNVGDVYRNARKHSSVCRTTTGRVIAGNSAVRAVKSVGWISCGRKVVSRARVSTSDEQCGGGKMLRLMVFSASHNIVVTVAGD
ncbi:hypothetical protein TNCV_858401 [Trichonephila clavipes]|nr:hypothetical protein TNCV_858401 [Trichonephila clavipes]